MPAKAKAAPADSKQGLLNEVNGKFGAGSLMELGSAPIIPVKVIPSGSIALDVALGIGGLPRGRVIEIYGPESTGKTTFALHAIANAQKNGGCAVMVDAEHALDMEYAESLGVDTEHLLLSQPDTGEQGLEIANMAVKSKVVDIVVIDSVAALTPRAEIEGVMGDSHVGLQARMMSQALRILTHNISDSNTTVIFINQLREKIGVMFGNPETTTGGKALKFYASIRLDIRRREVLKEGTVAVGHTVKVKVVKNKLAPPLKECSIDLIYGLGISREAEIVTLGVDCGFIKKSGAWFYFPDELGSAQGKENARLWLTEHSVVADELERLIKDKMMTSPLPARSVSPSPLADPVDLVGPGSLGDLVPVAIEEK